ncbi:MAG: RnfABCDGE type electron transport complex subunit G [Bacteroidales bacterium]|nr:RnfABCDGE type electron transport complex subunit G [Bacteroidales bacterium]
MEKLESSLRNMLISLGAICLVCAALLSSVNAMTAKRIARVQEQKTERAIAQVVPAFEGAPVDTAVILDGTEYLVHKAMVGDSIVGYAIESVTTGFGGPINLMVGFSGDGRIYSTAVISHSETPGLGAKMTDDESYFRTQFVGKKPSEYNLAVSKDGGDVDAITASTITSRAFTQAVAKAYNVYLAATGSSTDAVSSATPQVGEGENDE